MLAVEQPFPMAGPLPQEHGVAVEGCRAAGLQGIVPARYDGGGGSTLGQLAC